MIYLDNAATTYPKPEKVYTEMDRCLREYCANPGRGGHDMSITSGVALMQAREVVSRFFHINNPMQLIFTKNATEALNLAIQGFLNPGDHVITTSMEHNSVIRPLKTMERDHGVSLTIVQGNRFGEVCPEEIRKAVKNNTKLIVMTLSSNVNGMIMPIKEVGSIARGREIAFLVDASQGAGSLEIDVEEMAIDMLAFPGHKSLLGPQGTGGLYVHEKISLRPLLQGGTGSHSENMFQPDFMPDALESGTANTPGIVGLRFGIEFIEAFGLENMKLYKGMLVKLFHEGIEELQGIKIYSKKEVEKNSGIVALNFSEVDSTEVSYVLDKAYGIATRAGLHCAPLAHETLGTLQNGIVRFSVGCFNTIEEIELSIQALKEISNHLY